jgi:hyperosmotically inducible periplasmic protein
MLGGLRLRHNPLGGPAPALMNCIQISRLKKEIKMIKYIFAIAVLSTGMAFAGNNQPSGPVVKEVRHELVMLPYLDVFDNLTYSVDGGVVTLAGQVTRPTLKTDAEKVVQRIDGVERVDNQIEVLPLSNHDDRLRRSLYRAIYGYPSMNRYALPVIKPIRIIVKNGNVTLEGVVDNQADKSIANIRANGVHGVFSVTNNLRVGE